MKGWMLALGVAFLLLVAQGALILDMQKEAKALASKQRLLESDKAALNDAMHSLRTNYEILEAENAALLRKLEELELALSSQEKARSSTPDKTASDARIASAAPTEKPTKEASTGDAGNTAETPLHQMRNRFREMMKNPDMRTIVMQRQKRQLSRSYASLFRKMNLSEEEREAMMDLLVEQRGNRMASWTREKDEGSEAEEEAQKQAIETKMLELLGEERYAAYASYKESLPQRREVGRLQGELNEAGLSLAETQEEDLVRIMKDVADAMPSSVDFRNPRAWRDLSKIKEIDPQKIKQEYSAQTEQILQQAKSVLTPAQIEKLETYRQEHAEQIANHIRMGQFMMQSGGRNNRTK